MKTSRHKGFHLSRTAVYWSEMPYVKNVKENSWKASPLNAGLDIIATIRLSKRPWMNDFTRFSHVDKIYRKTTGNLFFINKTYTFLTPWGASSAWPLFLKYSMAMVQKNFARWFWVSRACAHKILIITKSNTTVDSPSLKPRIVLIPVPSRTISENFIHLNNVGGLRTQFPKIKTGAYFMMQ
jgi:hypothetical protein